MGFWVNVMMDMGFRVMIMMDHCWLYMVIVMNYDLFFLRRVDEQSILKEGCVRHFWVCLPSPRWWRGRWRRGWWVRGSGGCLVMDLVVNPMVVNVGLVMGLAGSESFEKFECFRVSFDGNDLL